MQPRVQPLHSSDKIIELQVAPSSPSLCAVTPHRSVTGTLDVANSGVVTVVNGYYRPPSPQPEIQEVTLQGDSLGGTFSLQVANFPAVTVDSDVTAAGSGCARGIAGCAQRAMSRLPAACCLLPSCGCALHLRRSVTRVSAAVSPPPSPAFLCQRWRARLNRPAPRSVASLWRGRLCLGLTGPGSCGASRSP